MVSKTQTQTVLPDGFSMRVCSWTGPQAHQDRSPIVFLHSLFFTGEMFSDVASSLAAHRDCYAPTYRGHGQQPTADKTPTVEQLARDIIDWMNVAELTQVHLVGSSMGAYVAMEMMRDHCDRIASVVLACCTCEEEADPARFDALADFIASGPHETTGHVISDIMFGRDSIAKPSLLVDSWIARFGQIPPQMAEAVTAMFAHPAYGDVITHYDGPALLMAGEQDRAKSVTDMEKIAANLPHAERHIFETAGHTPAVEMPDAFAARVARFIQNVETRHHSSVSTQTSGQNHVA